jgi:hypothetical protein
MWWQREKLLQNIGKYLPECIVTYPEDYLLRKFEVYSV